MNTTPSSPRFACRLVRLRAALGADPARSAHVAGCADCQRHFAAAASFETALRRDAVRSQAEIPAGLDRGILRAVAESRLAPAQAEKSPLSFAWLAGGALAAAAAVALVFALRSPATAPGGMVAETTPKAESPGSRETVLPSTPAFDLPTAEALAAQNPLQSELDQVYSDAQYALRFLAMNFLPTPREGDASRPRRGEG